MGKKWKLAKLPLLNNRHYWFTWCCCQCSIFLDLIIPGFLFIFLFLNCFIIIHHEEIIFFNAGLRTKGVYVMSKCADCKYAVKKHITEQQGFSVLLSYTLTQRI
ncbi:hypothetical protein U9M48_014975 [Paspalum notatum var. saurae]|uniref:Uncharacterized protein n=1 Tax=Paspalum notatum var. saurae TaxID=547442 RepID=A0AAQ3T3Y1_PASNO